MLFFSKIHDNNKEAIKKTQMLIKINKENIKKAIKNK